MRLDDQRGSSNYEERSGGSGGGGGGLRISGGHFGIGGLIIIGLLLIFAPDPVKRMVIGYLDGQGQITQDGGSPAETRTAPSDARGVFLTKVLGSTEDVWTALFDKGALAAYGAPAGTAYKPTKLVRFDGAVGTNCGDATAAVGPFYCPADADVYIDTAFFDELSNRFGSPGDFAQAYVVAHEVGHHVQDLLGLSNSVGHARGAESGSVRLELQADCFAGVWGRVAGDQKTGGGLTRLESGDLDEALTAANAIGDDTLQKAARGRVVPDSFTHGTSEQRQRWFRRGFDSGDPAQCDTFHTSQL